MKCLVFTASVLASLIVFADKVNLISGSSLSGKAGVVQGDKIVFVSDDLGEIKIPVENIASLESDNEHVIEYKDGTKTEKKVTVEEGAFVVVSGDKLEPLDMANVKAIDPVMPPPEKWHGSVNVSATANRGNSVGEAASVIADLNRRWEHDRLTAGAQFNYAQSGDSKETKQKTEQRFEIYAQEDHFWSKCFYSYVNGKYEFDKIMDLDYRVRVGTGLGYQWFEKSPVANGALSFNQELGATFVTEKYDDGFDDDFITFRYAHHLIWDPSIENLQFTHNFEYLPDVSEWAENYIIDADVGFTYAFLPNWQFMGRIEWDYKSQVAEGTKHSDLRYLFGLGYKW